MLSSILNYINKLEAYKIAVKSLHWSAEKMSEHKLCDEIYDFLNDNQDKISEIAQGVHGKIKLNQFRPKTYKVSSTKKMLEDLHRDSRRFYNKMSGKNHIGLRSVLESFIGEIENYMYLADLCIKEDFKQKIRKQIREERRKRIVTLNESQFRDFIKQRLNNIK